jgi:UDP-2,3-diacylglucosamine pyrophosphatase LpxH
MLDAVILSDLHLGASVCQQSMLVGFLENLKPPTRLILNGDVLDNDKQRLGKKSWRVLRLLSRMAKHSHLVWVAGNHDFNATTVAGMIGAEFVDRYSFVSGGKNILCVHGDMWDDFITNRPFLTAAGDYAYFLLQKLSHALARAIKRRSKTFLCCADKVRRGACKEALDTDHQIVCCGHTHCAEVVLDGLPTVYCNSGCWTENIAHHLTVDKGVVSLIETRANDHAITGDPAEVRHPS